MVLLYLLAIPDSGRGEEGAMNEGRVNEDIGEECDEGVMRRL